MKIFEYAFRGLIALLILIALIITVAIVSPLWLVAWLIEPPREKHVMIIFPKQLVKEGEIWARMMN